MRKTCSGHWAGVAANSHTASAVLCVTLVQQNAAAVYAMLGTLHQDLVMLPVQHILEPAGCQTHNVCCQDASTAWRGLQSTQT